MIEPKLFAEGQDGHNFIYFKGPVPPFPLIAQRDFVIQTFQHHNDDGSYIALAESITHADYPAEEVGWVTGGI